MNRSFSISEILKQSWDYTKEHIFVVLGLLLLSIIVNFVLGITGAIFKESMPVVYIFILIVSNVIQLLLAIGIIKICLCIVHHREYEFADVLPTLTEIINYVVATIIIGFFAFLLILPFAFGLGMSFSFENITEFNYEKLVSEMSTWSQIYLLILISVFIYLGLRIQFYRYLIFDTDCSAWESIVESMRITNGHTLNIFLFLLALVLLNILGALALLVGLLFTIPMSVIAVAVLYRTLSENDEDEELVEEEA